MADKLKAHGWQYIVVDIQWYEPNANSFNYRQNAKVVLDEFGRLWPATNRFPSAANGVGFKALSDYVHGKGLKFGIHLMRGIPRQAVRQNTLVKGTNVRARDIANTNSICEWNPDMYGVDMTKLQSRPVRGFGSGGWQYVFYVDIEGHQSDPAVAKAIAQIREEAGSLKVLGSYPVSVSGS